MLWENEKLNKQLVTEKQIWWLQILLPTFFAYLLVRYLLDPAYFNKIFYGINLGFHEAGHYIIFPFFGEFVMTLGGSLFECLAPVLIGASFYFKKDFLATTFCLGWLGTALFDSANYIADAKEMQLELLFGSHDWNFLLSELGLLQYDNAIALAVRFLGITVLAISTVWGYSISWNSFLQSKRR